MIFSCQLREEKTIQRPSGPKVVEAHGYVVPVDSMEPPNVIDVEKHLPITIPSGKSIKYYTNKNYHIAGLPKIVNAGFPRICTPGRDTFKQPEKISVNISLSKLTDPEIVKSKDASFGNSNSGLFSTYSKMQGLNHNQISSMIEDKAGNIWFGTEGAGVTKFDGRNFTQFTAENGLSHNNVMSILEDNNNNIWFGYYDGLFDKYDGQNITKYQLPEGNRDLVQSINEDNDGNIWFNSNIGVIKYDGVSFFQYSYKQGLQLGTILSIINDKNGNLWFAGLGGIAKFDGTSFYHYSQKEGLLSDFNFSILEDKSGNLWIGHESGVSKFNNSTFSQYTTNEGVPAGSILQIKEDYLGHIWFGTADNGIFKFDNTYFSHFTTQDGLEANTIESILSDKMHNLWIGTYGGGVSKYNSHHFTNYTSIEDLDMKNVQGIAADHDGNFWFCHKKEGIVKFNGEYFEHFKDTELSTAYRFNKILFDLENTIWLSGPQGVAKFNHGEFTYFFKNDFRSFTDIRNMTLDNKGNIWVCTWGEGVSMFDGQKLIQFKTENGISSDNNASIHFDSKGNIWIGSWEKGVTKLTPIDLKNKMKYSCTHYSEKNGLSQKSVYGIHEDSGGNIWFGTWGGGVSRFDGNRFTHITSKEGLINNFVYSILEDKNQNIWLGTRLGLSQLRNSFLTEWFGKRSTTYKNGFKSGIENYSFEDGFLGIGCKSGGLIEDKKGNIWVLTDNTITTFPLRVNKEITDSIAPNVQINAVKLFNEKIDWSNLQDNLDTSFTIGNGVKVGKFKFTGLSKWYSLPENLSLAYNNNYITFNYIGITQKNANKVMYQYILEGNNENWSAFTPFTEAHYSNLPHGRYTFKVKAMNNEGFWSEEFHYPFTIRPPWWLTWWANFIYLISFIFLGWRIHIYQKEKTIRTEQDKAKDRELAQAKEIEKAFTELKKTQLQLIQSEKMASLGELTAGIAHEIQNPLNFVNNFSEVSNELIDDMEEELKKGDIKEGLSIAGDLKQNLEKISHHGNRASEIVKSMLQHSRIGTGQKDFTDINVLCDEYLRLSYHGLRAKDNTFNASFQTHFDATLPEIKVIPQDIGRVLLNIINNAFYAVNERSKKATEGYTPEVSISTVRKGDMIEIKISDNGGGIPDHIKEKIFQPFFTTKPTGQGTGLGLSLSYDIVKAHGGELKVESLPTGQTGSEFIISLPFQKI
jgi:signal transduction histidine kinase/ligand-binding sensor domain-containing protein